MEGNLSLNVKDEITLHLDHKVHGQHRPCTVFLSCSEGRIGIGINIIDKLHRDDVGVVIENGRMVTVKVKPVHAFHRQFCIDGPVDAEPVEPVIDTNIKNRETEELTRGDRQLRSEIQDLLEATEQLEQQRKNEQGSRIYYQELVQSIRAVVVGHCKQARGCKTDELPAFVKAAFTLAHQDKLGQAIANIKGHHGCRQ